MSFEAQVSRAGYLPLSFIVHWIHIFVLEFCLIQRFGVAFLFF